MHPNTTNNEVKASLHSGDLGDIIYYLPVAKAQGIERIYYADRPVTKPTSKGKYLFLKRLIENCGIEFLYEEPKEKVFPAWNFRSGGLPIGVTLTDLQARFANVDVSKEVWLKAEHKEEFRNKIILHRSPRYNNQHFPLQEISEYYEKDIIAIGTPEEVEQLRNTCQFKFPHSVFEDAQDLCNAIYSCRWYVGNQSSPMALAIGSGARFTQELCPWAPDCIFPREHCFYSFDGYAEVEGISFGEMYCKNDFTTNCSPPGGWQATAKNGNKIKNFIYRGALKELIRYGDSEKEAAKKLEDYYFSVLPDKRKKVKNGDLVASLLLKNGIKHPNATHYNVNKEIFGNSKTGILSAKI